MNRKLLSITSLSLLSINAFSTPATHQEASVKNIKDIIPYTQKMAQDYGKDNVCIVCDIDNTLFTNKGKYASESWVYWQASKGNQYAHKLLDDNNANIHDYLNAIRYFINYHTVEADTAKIVNSITTTIPKPSL